MNAYDDRGILALLARRYGEQPNWGRHDFMVAHGSVYSAILYAPLLVPRFVEIEGAVFLSDVLPEGSEQKIEAGHVGELSAFEIYRGSVRGHRMANLRLLLR